MQMFVCAYFAPLVFGDDQRFFSDRPCSAASLHYPTLLLYIKIKNTQILNCFQSGLTQIRAWHVPKINVINYARHLQQNQFTATKISHTYDLKQGIFNDIIFVRKRTVLSLELSNSRTLTHTNTHTFSFLFL